MSIIYESPDGGKTVYSRLSRENNRWQVDKEWHDILKTAESNPSVKRALDQLRTTYYLSKSQEKIKINIG